MNQHDKQSPGLTSIDPDAHVGDRRHSIEVIEEDPGKFSWRVVLRDVDTMQEIGAPEQSIQLYATAEEARQAGEAAVRRIETGSFTQSEPRATP